MPIPMTKRFCGHYEYSLVEEDHLLSLVLPNLFRRGSRRILVGLCFLLQPIVTEIEGIQ